MLRYFYHSRVKTDNILAKRPTLSRPRKIKNKEIPDSFRYTICMGLNAFSANDEAENYIAFLESADGYFQRHLLAAAILKRLPQTQAGYAVLDAGCGTGWLTRELKTNGFEAYGCDQSKPLLGRARSQYPELPFAEADIRKPLPYGAKQFDTVIANMAAQDVAWLSAMYANIFTVLKDGGTLVITIPNPFYAFPKAVWKRGFWGRLRNQKPTLQFARKKFPPLEGKPVTTFPRPLADYINQATKQKFSLRYLEELRSETDNNEFGLQYQLYRYPLILLLEFEKK